MIKFDKLICFRWVETTNQAGYCCILGGLNTTELGEDYDKAL